MGILDSIRNFLKRKENIKTLDRASVSERYDKGNNFISELQAEVKENQMERKDAILQILISMGLDEEYKKSPGASAELCDICDEMLCHKLGEDFEISLIDERVVKKVEAAIRDSIKPFFLSAPINVCVYEKYDKTTDELTTKHRTVSFKRMYPTEERVNGPMEQPIFTRSTTEIVGKLEGKERPQKYLKKSIYEEVTETGITMCRKERKTENRVYGDKTIADSDYHISTYRAHESLEPLSISVGYKTYGDFGYDGVNYESRFELRNSLDADMADIKLPISNEQIQEMLVNEEIPIYRGTSEKDILAIQEKINSMVPDYSKETKDESICKKQREQMLEKARNSKNQAVREWLVNSGYFERKEINQDIER